MLYNYQVWKKNDTFSIDDDEDKSGVCAIHLWKSKMVMVLWKTIDQFPKKVKLTFINTHQIYS